MRLRGCKRRTLANLLVQKTGPFRTCAGEAAKFIRVTTDVGCAKSAVDSLGFFATAAVIAFVMAMLRI